MSWLISKLFWLVAQPQTIISLIVLVGLVLTFFGRRRRLGQGVIAGAIACLAVISYSNLGALILQPLEARYPRPPAFPENIAGLIVLGGGTENSISAARGAYELSDSGDRYVEAVRLVLAHPGLALLVSGGVGSIDGAGETDAESVARLFAAFGLTGTQISYEAGSRNTYENAVHAAALLHPQPGQRYMLVTSAFHMPRAVALFERAGFGIVPWPVDFKTTGREGFALSLVDASDNVGTLTKALHEWLGLFAYWGLGRIDSPWP